MYRFLDNIKPDKAIVALYKEILLDLKQSDNKEKQDNIKAMKKNLESINEKINKVQEKWLEGIIDDDTFKSMNSRLNKEKQDLDMNLSELKEKTIAKDADIKFEYALNFIEKMGSCISVAPIEIKLHILGSIFSEKIVFENLNPRTAELSPLIALITGKTEICKGVKKEGLSKFNESPAKGGWWVSNPRPPEPQSGALANWATATIYVESLSAEAGGGTKLSDAASVGDAKIKSFCQTATTVGQIFGQSSDLLEEIVCESAIFS